MGARKRGDARGRVVKVFEEREHRNTMRTRKTATENRHRLSCLRWEEGGKGNKCLQRKCLQVCGLTNSLKTSSKNREECAQRTTDCKSAARNLPRPRPEQLEGGKTTVSLRAAVIGIEESATPDKRKHGAQRGNKNGGRTTQQSKISNVYPHKKKNN